MWTCSKRTWQRGDVLLEALIGVLLTAILGAGMAHVASRIAVSQRDAKVEQLALAGLRAQLQDKGVALCETAPDSLALGEGALAASLQVSCVDAAELPLTVAGQTLQVQPPREISLVIPAADLQLAAASGSDDATAQPGLVMGTRQLPDDAP